MTQLLRLLDHVIFVDSSYYERFPSRNVEFNKPCFPRTTSNIITWKCMITGGKLKR